MVGGLPEETRPCWIKKFNQALEGMRYDWIAGRARDNGTGPLDVQAYLDHASSVLVWMAHFPRWASYEHDDLLDQVETKGLEPSTPAVQGQCSTS